MKIHFLSLFFLLLISIKVYPQSEIEIIYSQNQTAFQEADNGILKVLVSESDLAKFKKLGFVSYNDFGAIGDGKTDDQNSIVATHAFANKNGLSVKANEGANYYIGGNDRKAIIQTDTDFGKASFTIDDRNVKNRTTPIFEVKTSLDPIKLEGVTSLKKGQKKLDLALDQAYLVTVTDTTIRRYIRFGLNQNNGYPQTDNFRIEKNGKIDPKSPIIWDFDQITDITALPIDEKTLNITGGHFTTIANQEESKYNYYSRNLLIRRSNVIVDGIRHSVTGEGEHGAPYGGFITIQDCADVKVMNSIFTGHKTYSTIGRAGKPVSMGSYDLSVNRALNVSFINCSQTNDINDRTYWGIFGSNYSKNLLYDNCTLSRFDAHMGVANATIRNSELGHMGINAIGSGTLLVENSTINSGRLINLRSDYGSTWEGEFIIKDCVFKPNAGNARQVDLISGFNSGQHDFGYVCYMPEAIKIINLSIEDASHSEEYDGPMLFANFNPERNDANYQEEFPYLITKKVILKNIKIASGKALGVSKNPIMFQKVEIDGLKK